MRIVELTIGSLLALASNGSYASETARVTLHIEAEPVRLALKDFGEQTGLQIMGRSEDMAQATVLSPRISGEISMHDALERLLANTNLGYRFVNPTTVLISLKEQPSRETSSMTTDSAMSLGHKGPDEARLLAQTNDQAPGRQVTTGADTAGNDAEAAHQLGEIIVTAQKKSERLQDVPVPISVVDTQALAATNQVQIRDFYATVPGLNAMGGIYPGANTLLSIRGVNSGGGGPTVGVLIDDVPFGAANGGNGGTDLPEFDPGDLSRIEVLRGPQGTLYGTDSMGGLLKYVTTDPSTAGYSGRIEAGVYGVFRGDEPGYSIRASANIPLADTLAMRVSGFHRQDAGYIENVEAGQKGANEGKANGARLSLLWRPSDDVSLKVSALYQDIRANGAPDVTVGPGLGDLQQSYLSGAGRYERQLGFASAALNVNLNHVLMTSLTAFGRSRTLHSLDYSYYFGSAGQSLYGPNVSGSLLYNQDNVDKFSQELRFSGSLSKHIDWLVGGYYSHELNNTGQHANAMDPATGEIFSSRLFIYSFSPEPVYEEYALFADLTYHFTDKLQVQVGGRGAHYDGSSGENTTLLGNTLSLTPPLSASGNPFTYLFTPQYKISDDWMLYARFASGFRPGGPNSVYPGIPPQVNSDKTENYELGVKGDFLEHKLSLDASIYHIAFKGIQLLLLTTDGHYYSANGGNAKSDGIELSLDFRATADFTISGWVDYDDAALTQDFPAGSTAYGRSGNRLPYGSRWSGSLAAEQRFPVADGITGFVSGVASVVGDRLGQFQATALRQDFPSYTRVDLRAGLERGSWTAGLYANNITDRRGLIAGGMDANPPSSFTYIQPRTIGLNVVKKFN